MQLCHQLQSRQLGRGGRACRPQVLAHAAVQAPAPPHLAAADLTAAKAALLHAVRDTNRGSTAGRFKRGSIEELQVAVESFQAAQDLDFSLLGGLWQLEFTTAADVLPILELDTWGSTPLGPGPFRVGLIGQEFTSPVDGRGSVNNVIQLGVPGILEGKQGVTLTVEARYEVRSGHRILLNFEAARVGDVRISEGVEALLAPAILPRTSLQHMLLLAIKQFQLRVPFRNAAEVAASLTSQTSAGGAYQLTFLDADMLIGRATAIGGTFIFSRAARR